MLKPYGEAIASPYEMAHTETAVNELITRILSSDGEARAVMEATGAYHPPLLVTLKQTGLFFSVINPLTMKEVCLDSFAIPKINH